jgi:peptide/nickel transport system substrate-binding protein
VPEFSIDAAREALAASATPDGFSVELRVDETQPWMSPLAQSLAQNAAEIGITVDVISVSSGDWIADLTNPEGSPLQLLALGAGTPWPGELPPVIVGTNAGFNPSKYGGGEIDDLVGQIASAGELDTLMPPLTDLLTRMGDDLPYVPLFDEQSAVAISNDFVWEGGYSYWSLGQSWTMQLGGAG